MIHKDVLYKAKDIREAYDKAKKEFNKTYKGEHSWSRFVLESAIKEWRIENGWKN